MKAKIVIDMPDGCGDCRFYGLTGWIGSCLALEPPLCFAEECDADNTDRLRACPLIPIVEENNENA